MAKTGKFDPGISDGTIKCTGMLITASATVKLKDLSAYRAVITEIQPLIWYDNNFKSTIGSYNNFQVGSAEFEQAIKGGNMSVTGSIMGCFEDEGDKPKILCGGEFLRLYDKSDLFIPDLY